MPGHSHTGGSHTLWGSLMCDRPGIYVGTTYNIVFWTAHYIVVGTLYKNILLKKIW